jgi:lycopene beta-cyclase
LTKRYEQEIKQYIENLGIQNFEIIKKEKISIPWPAILEENYQRVLNIETAGGGGLYFQKLWQEVIIPFLQQDRELKSFIR